MRNSSPYEYTLTFSPLNAYVILPGLFLVIVPQVTGPVYGWGKYNLIPGKFIFASLCNSDMIRRYLAYLFFEGVSISAAVRVMDATLICSNAALLTTVLSQYYAAFNRVLI